MAIGILALTIGAIFTAISFAGIRSVECPAREERKVNFPYPKEINMEVNV